MATTLSEVRAAKLTAPGAILLVSCYELGHQPLGVAMPAGFLRRAGYAPELIDIAVESFDEAKAARAGFVGISVPMHTALRLGIKVIERIREVNPQCHICCYGLYAALNSQYLLDHGADSCIGGEYEAPLVNLIQSLDMGRDPDANSSELDGVIDATRAAKPHLVKLPFVVPARSCLPGPDSYAQLDYQGNCRKAGYVEASRGCLHLCTHCPIPPVYNGRFFVIPEDVILEDIRQQVEAGIEHITFGDPDFLNGPKHSLRVVRAMRRQFPNLTFDFTAKVEHLLNRGDYLAEFGESGCLFIISAVESLSDRVLEILAKHHTRSDIESALKICRSAGISLRPTWVTFTPWTTLEDFREVLRFVEANELIDNVDPVQYAIRLLIPPGSWLAEHPATLPHRGELDESAFTYRWQHPDPRMDEIQKEVSRVVEAAAQEGEDPAATFYKILDLAHDRAHQPRKHLNATRPRPPRMTESWFC